VYAPSLFVSWCAGVESEVVVDDEAEDLMRVRANVSGAMKDECLALTEGPNKLHDMTSYDG
jgi:hypothetical protein